MSGERGTVARAQPTPELEAENAAYIWARECLREHIHECRKAEDYLSDSNWQEIAWTFERLRIAVDRHRELEGARLAATGATHG